MSQYGGGQSSQKRRSKTSSGSSNSVEFSTTASAKMGPPNTDTYHGDNGREDTNYSTSVEPSQQTRITSSRLPQNPVPRRQAQPMTRSLPRPPRPSMQQQLKQIRANPKTHWLLPLGVGMMAMLVLWVTGSWVLAWGVQRYNDLHYGIPRTYQVDAVVGHGGDSPAHPSHFIALNLNRQAIVIELMAGDPAKSVSYVAPVYIAGDGGDLAPVTVEFRDVTRDNKLDMIIHIHLPNQDQLSVFVNTGDRFRPSNGNDKISI